MALSCKLDGYPFPSIEWQKDNSTLPVDNSGTQPELKMTVEKASAESAGMYTVIAKNVGGESKSNCSVRVQGRKIKLVKE